MYYNKIGGGRLPHCGYVVADGNGRHHDDAADRRHCHQARQLHAAAPGIVPVLLDETSKKPVSGKQRRHAVYRAAVAGMLRGLWGDQERYKSTYWQRPRANYLTGDNARIDDDGYYWIMGRIDDVINVSGHRLSTIEVESALVSHPLVAEAAAVGRPDELKGQAVAVFVTLKSGEADDNLRKPAEAACTQGNRGAGRAGRHSLYRFAAEDGAAVRSCVGCSAISPRQRVGAGYEHAGRLHRAAEAARG